MATPVATELGPQDDAFFESKSVDANADIAEKIDGIKMLVSRPGRMTNQSLYLGKTTTYAWDYKEYTDADRTGNLEPSKEELVEGEKTYEYLEVGLIIANNQDKHKIIQNTPRSKTAEAARRNLGISTLDPCTLRAVIPRTGFVTKQAKYYVACKPVNGRCMVRKIDASKIYFYPEFLRSCDKSTKRDRREAIHRLCRIAAAYDRSIQTEPDDALTSQQGLTRSVIEELIPECMLLLESFDLKDDVKDLVKIIRCLENASPDLKFGPMTQDNGLYAFYEAEHEDFTLDDALNVKQELESAHPQCTGLDVELILRVRKIVHEWPEPVPYSGFPFFMALCQRDCKVDFDDDALEQALRSKYADTLLSCQIKHPLTYPRSVAAGQDLAITQSSLQTLHDIHAAKISCRASDMANMQDSLNHLLAIATSESTQVVLNSAFDHETVCGWTKAFESVKDSCAAVARWIDIDQEILEMHESIMEDSS